MGHGTTPLYAARNKINYLGFDTNKRAFSDFLNILQHECKIAPGCNVNIECRDSTIFLPELKSKFDLCYTSPPYFNFEEYGGNTEHFSGCKTYEDFHKKITAPVFINVHQYLISGGILALQLEKKKVLVKKWKSVILSLGFDLLESRLTGQEKEKYSMMSKRDQSLLVFVKK
jgi:DNA modification methylase